MSVTSHDVRFEDDWRRVFQFTASSSFGERDYLVFADFRTKKVQLYRQLGEDYGQHLLTIEGDDAVSLVRSLNEVLR